MLHRRAEERAARPWICPTCGEPNDTDACLSCGETPPVGTESPPAIPGFVGGGTPLFLFFGRPLAIVFFTGCLLLIAAAVAFRLGK